MTKISQWVSTMASETPGSTVSLVGQGSFLDKPSLHMVGYLGKNANAFETPPDGWCPVCKSKGHLQALKTYRINFTQSIFLCSNPQCIFPLGYTPLDNIIANTVDLKNPSPNKQKKRNISEVSPIHLPRVKRAKIDLPILGEYPPSIQSNWGESVPVLPPLACEVSPPRTSLQCCKAKDGDTRVQNVSETGNSFSSFTSVLREEPPVISTGSPSRDVSDPAEPLHANQGILQEGLLPTEVVEMGMKNDVFFQCENPNAVNIQKVSNTGHIGSSEDQKHLNSEIDDTGVSSRDPGALKNLTFSPVHVFKSPPLLQCNQLRSPVKESSPTEVSSPPCGVDVPDVGKDSVLESGLPQSCEILQNSVCEILESSLLQDTQSGQQVEAMGTVLNVGHRLSSAHGFIQETPTSKCESTVSSCLWHNKSDQEIKVNSLLDMYAPPTSSAGPVEENSIVNPAVSPLKHGVSEPSHFMQDGCEVTPASLPLQDILHVCPSQDNSLPTHTTSPVVKEDSIESSTVRELSQPKNLVEDIEKSQRGTATPSCTVLECHQPDGLSKDDHSLSCVSDISCMIVSVGEYSSDVTLANLSLPEPQERAQDCRASNSETTNRSRSLQVSLPDCRSEEKSLRNVPDSPVSDVKDKPTMNSAAVLLQANLLTELLDLVHDCQINNTGKPPDSLQDIQQVCPAEDKSLDVYGSSSVVKGNSIELVAAALNICHLSQPKDLVENIEKSQRETSSPSPLLEGHQSPDSLSKDDHSLSCVSDISFMTASVGEYSSDLNLANISLPEPQERAQDCWASNSETTNFSHHLQDSLPDCQSEEKSLRNVPGSPVSDVKDKPTVNSVAVLLQENRLTEVLDLVHDCQKNDTGKPSDSLQDIQSVCHSETTSLMGVSDPLCTTSVVKPDINADAATLLDRSLSNPQNMMQDCPTRHCVTSTPSVGIQEAHSLKDNSMIVIGGSTCDITAVMDDCDNENTTLLLLSDNHFLDSPMDSCESSVTAHSQTKHLLDQQFSPLRNTGAAIEGLGNVKPPLLSDCGLSVSKQDIKKPFHENPVLPDLLLDIQPEHRMEEPLAASPSPACEVPVSARQSSTEPVEQRDLLQEGQGKQYDKSKQNEVNEISSTVTNHSGLHDSGTLSETLSSETTLNADSLAQDESMNASTVESKQVPKTPGRRTFQNSQRRLQWKNKYSLCWLDCVLSALVQSEMLNNFVAKGDNNKELIHYLFAKYEEASTMLPQWDKRRKSGGTQKLDKCLNEVRMYIFDKLKPFLKCELGQKETPVFAFPLLLKLDPEIEELFMHTYTWNFKCEVCGYSCQERCQKTMTTFTKVVPDWRPLNAVHTAPCNKCQNADQRRALNLEKLHSVFMVHFVEGLPTNDLEEYSFHFNGHLYQIRTVIRYRYDHFSSWTANDDGSWLESDDLKGTFCRRHQKCRVRAEDIHVVMWEKSNAKTAGTENPPLSTTDHSELNASNQSISIQEENLCLSASTESPIQVAPAAKSVNLNMSNPLAGMEGYADDDIITLTLVEIPLDTTGNPVDFNPSDNCTARKEANQVLLVPQPAQLKVPINSLPLTQHSQRNGIFSPPILASSQPIPANSNAKTVPSVDCNVLQSPPPMLASPNAKTVPSVDCYVPQSPPPMLASPNAKTVPSVDCYVPQSPLPMLASPNAKTVPSVDCNVPQSPVIQNITKPGFNKQATPIATSTPFSQPYSTKKSIVGSWMNSLIIKDNSLLNGNLCGAKQKNPASKPCPPLKITDLSGASKTAQNFDGFRAKCVNKTANSVESPGFQSENGVSFNPPKEKTAPSLKTFLTPSSSSHLKPGNSGLNYGNLLKDRRPSSENRIRKLRLKLLKKLKAKKNELATLERMAKIQQSNSCSDQSDFLPQGSLNRREHLRGFLQELQEQIDNADNESVCTMSSSTSICSSPGDAEFFAELFSPSPMDNSANDSSYLEMLADGFAISTDQSQQTNGHNHPTDNNGSLQSTSGSNSCLKTSTLNRSTRDESFDLMSSSRLNEDTEYFPSFDYIF
ncbi:SUMO-specific isopeptidase USPL1 isoform X2 [Mixophyes fleayi]